MATKCYVENILKPLMLESAKDHFDEDTHVDISTRRCDPHAAKVSQNWCHDHLLRFWSKEMLASLHPSSIWNFLHVPFLKQKPVVDLIAMLTHLKRSLSDIMARNFTRTVA